MSVRGIVQGLRPGVTNWKKWGFGFSIEFGPEQVGRFWIGPWRWGWGWMYDKPPDGRGVTVRAAQNTERKPR